MPKLNIVWRDPRHAIKPARPQRRLLAAGSRLYRTTQRADVFYWPDEPESTTAPIRRPPPRPPRPGKTASRPRPLGAARIEEARRLDEEARRRGDRGPTAVEAPVEAFVNWLTALYRAR